MKLEQNHLVYKQCAIIKTQRHILYTNRFYYTHPVSLYIWIMSHKTNNYKFTQIGLYFTNCCIHGTSEIVTYRTRYCIHLELATHRTWTVPKSSTLYRNSHFFCKSMYRMRLVPNRT